MVLGRKAKEEIFRILSDDGEWLSTREIHVRHSRPQLTRASIRAGLKSLKAQGKIERRSQGQNAEWRTVSCRIRGIMTGHACHIRQLKPDDVEIFKIDLGDVPIEECVGVWGEDLGECLAAVVHLKASTSSPLVWVDSDNQATCLTPNEFVFADAVGVVLMSLFPHIRELRFHE